MSRVTLDFPRVPVTQILKGMPCVRRCNQRFSTIKQNRIITKTAPVIAISLIGFLLFQAG
jgi:hypothetical protein